MDDPRNTQPSLSELLQNGEFERFKQRIIAEPALFKPEYEEDETPMTLAIKAGSIELVEFLIGLGCPLSDREFDGETYLVDAMRAKENSLAIAKLLLDAGADMGPHGPEEPTALHWAARLDAWEIGDELIRRGADIDARDLDGEAPLHYAARAGHPRMVRLFLRVGADRTIPGPFGDTAEDIARGRDDGPTLRVFDEFPR